MNVEKGFTFYPITSRNFPSLAGGEAQNLLMQWSLKGRLHCQCFSFDESFKDHDIEAFAKVLVDLSSLNLKALFQDESVCQLLKSEKRLPMGEFEIKITPVPCMLTSMELFDRCIGTVTHESGRIKSCFDECYGTLVISDCLTSMMCIEDSEYYNLYSEREREEFLFRLLKHIVIGGELVQPSENFDVYANFVKNLYKDIISVQKRQDSNDLVITSKVYEIQVWCDGLVVYPSVKEHLNDFAYLIVNPIMRHVIILSHVYGIGDF